MSDSSTSPPEILQLDEQFHPQGEKLQIRLVPYSPPRLSSDGSVQSRPVSYIDSPPSVLVLKQDDNVEIHAGDDSPSILAPSVSGRSMSLTALDGGNEDSQMSYVNMMRSPGDLKSRLSSLSLSPSLASLTSSTPSPSQSPRRHKRVINVNLHSDKTFSLVPESGSVSSRTDSYSSPQQSSANSYGSRGRLSSGIFSDRPSSPLTPLAEHSIASAQSSSPSHLTATKAVPDPPWNLELVGGLRKVRSVASVRSLAHSLQLSLDESLPAQDEIIQFQDSHAVLPLATKPSFQSTETRSTLSDRTNYKLYGRSSPVVGPVDDSTLLDADTALPSNSELNYAIHEISDPQLPSWEALSRPTSENSEPNYIIYWNLSRTPSIITTTSQVRPEYSRESLVVAPLQPLKASRSAELFLASKLPSQDSSIVESPASASNFADQDISIALSSVAAVSGQLRPALLQRSLPRQHQWSTALSTVFSESERDSAPPSRSLSRLSFSPSRGNAFLSNINERANSLSSGFAGLDEDVGVAPHSRNVSLDRPQPVYNRDLTACSPRLIHDQDEDGDGLADLQDLHRRSSRVRHQSFLSNVSSDRNLRSAGSVRTNSFTYASIPTWAKLYYGSGERRFLVAQASYESMFSQFSGSQPRNSLLSRSPSCEQFSSEINNPRRRPREIPHQDDELAIVETSPNPDLNVARVLKKQTSSVWSPHLHQDKRASRHSIWIPPSIAESSVFVLWARNIQLILFVFGFVIPFAWMLGGVLPLPTGTHLDMVERDCNTSQRDLRSKSRQRMRDINEARMHSRINWWRRINRRMSILGIFLIGAYISLIIVGLNQKWTVR